MITAIEIAMKPKSIFPATLVKSADHNPKTKIAPQKIIKKQKVNLSFISKKFKTELNIHKLIFFVKMLYEYL